MYSCVSQIIGQVIVEGYEHNVASPVQRCVVWSCPSNTYALHGYGMQHVISLEPLLDLELRFADKGASF